MIDLQEQHEFVDYYALLEVPATTDEKELRKRIFDMYDEARQNLEHRSHRKRFYYVSLYETHLARARYFLLDTDKRPRYDACLRAYQEGNPFDYRALFEKKAAEKPTATAAATAVEPVASAVAAPQTAPPAEGLVDHPAANHAPVAPIGAVAAAAPVKKVAAQAGASEVRVPETHPAAAIGGPTTSAAAPSQTAAPVAERSESADRLEKLLRTPTLDPAQIGRRRDYQRRELIGGELKAQGRFSSLITFSISLLIGTLLLWKLEASLTSPTDGTLTSTDVVVILMAIAILCGFAYLAGWYASRLTRRQIIAKLSRMSYDELLRHCRN